MSYIEQMLRNNKEIALELPYSAHTNGRLQSDSHSIRAQTFEWIELNKSRTEVTLWASSILPSRVCALHLLMLSPSARPRFHRGCQGLSRSSEGSRGHRTRPHPSSIAVCCSVLLSVHRRLARAAGGECRQTCRDLRSADEFILGNCSLSRRGACANRWRGLT